MNTQTAIHGKPTSAQATKTPRLGRIVDGGAFWRLAIEYGTVGQVTIAQVKTVKGGVL